jgi:hypothetical protein
VAAFCWESIKEMYERRASHNRHRRQLITRLELVWSGLQASLGQLLPKNNNVSEGILQGDPHDKSYHHNYTAIAKNVFPAPAISKRVSLQTHINTNICTSIIGTSGATSMGGGSPAGN